MIVDLAFALDCTGSMEPWIDAARRQIRQTVQELSEQYQTATFRVGAVLYRDFGDVDHQLTIPFTEDLHSFEESLKNVRAKGGSDDAEDVAGAFHHANQLDWQGQVKTLFHITDAPPHGLQYHDIHLGDRYPDVDPLSQNLEEEVLQLASKNITLVVIKANESVNKMITEFARMYGTTTARFQVQNLEGQMYPQTPPRRGALDMLEPPVLRRRTRDTPEMRTITHMVSTVVQESMSMADPY